MRTRWTALGIGFVSLVLLAVGRAAGAETNEYCFPVGEKLFYRLYWGLIPVGDAWATTAITNENGRRLLVIKLTAQTGSIVSQLYPVDDSIETVIDASTFLTVRYTQRVREGTRSRDEQVVFDRTNNVAHWLSLTDGSTNDIPIESETRDVLCLLYYMRCKGLKMKEVAKAPVFVDDTLYTLLTQGQSEQKVYMSNFGEVKCLKVEPKAKFGEVFVRKGRVFMWFSMDARRVMTKAAAKVPVASVKVILQRVEGPGNDYWLKPDPKKGPAPEGDDKDE